MMEFYKSDLATTCRSQGFIRRGNTYFRLWGDGVLQVIKCTRERSLWSNVIYVGLFSMYGELERQWFTAIGAIPRYPVINCYNQNQRPLIFAQDMDMQLMMLKTRVLPWLDTIDTQKKLVMAIGKLDSRWNDDLKIGPYLACGESNHAKKVIREILAQHGSGNWFWVPDEDGEPEKKGDRALLAVIDVIDAGDEAIQSYIKANYETNMSYAQSCLGLKL